MYHVIFEVHDKVNWCSYPYYTTDNPLGIFDLRKLVDCPSTLYEGPLSLFRWTRFLAFVLESEGPTKSLVYPLRLHLYTNLFHLEPLSQV